MNSTRTSVLIIPGKRSGNISHIINSQDKNALCGCHNENINSKIIKNSNSDVIPVTTRVERIVTNILYSPGGRVTYGNIVNGNLVRRSVFLGRSEGQPGGIIGPLRNKF